MRGPFEDLDDFITRVNFHMDQLVLLIRGGAFDFTKRTKAELLWRAHLHKCSLELPNLKTSALQNAYDEIELYGFPVTMSWFDLLQTSFRGELMAVQMMKFIGRRFRMLGKLVTIKYVRTCKGEPMALGTFVDATGEAFDTVHFPQVYKAYPFQGDGVYLLLGKVTEEFGQPSLQVEKMAKMPYKPRK
jgi:DNA polymerase-3 subunit alpha